MGTQLIEYTYSGDEEAWRATIETFLGHIRANPMLAAGFTYAVYIRPDGGARVHVPVWKDQAVLERLQAAPFFKEFSAAINGFAGDTLKTTKPDLLS